MTFSRSGVGQAAALGQQRPWPDRRSTCPGAPPGPATGREREQRHRHLARLDRRRRASRVQSALAEQARARRPAARRASSAPSRRRGPLPPRARRCVETASIRPLATSGGVFAVTSIDHVASGLTRSLLRRSMSCRAASMRAASLFAGIGRGGEEVLRELGDVAIEPLHAPARGEPQQLAARVGREPRQQRDDRLLGFGVELGGHVARPALGEAGEHGLADLRVGFGELAEDLADHGVAGAACVMLRHARDDGEGLGARPVRRLDESRRSGGSPRRPSTAAAAAASGSQRSLVDRSVEHGRSHGDRRRIVRVRIGQCHQGGEPDQLLAVLQELVLHGERGRDVRRKRQRRTPPHGSRGMGECRRPQPASEGSTPSRTPRSLAAQRAWITAGERPRASSDVSCSMIADEVVLDIPLAAFDQQPLGVQSPEHVVAMESGDQALRIVLRELRLLARLAVLRHDPVDAAVRLVT